MSHRAWNFFSGGIHLTFPVALSASHGESRLRGSILPPQKRDCESKMCPAELCVLFLLASILNGGLCFRDWCVLRCWIKGIWLLWPSVAINSYTSITREARENSSLFLLRHERHSLSVTKWVCLFVLSLGYSKTRGNHSLSL